jgi:prepilin-type N-terminal cleavage/methylation domain-containing protein
MSAVRNNRKGFTLMELLVVIALVALLVTVMVPVMLNFMRGRGLSMAGNNIGGFVSFARSEAMNWRLPHVLVMHEEEFALSSGGEMDLTEYVGPGIAIYRINPDFDASQDEQEITYVKQLNFSSGIGGNVDFAQGWKQDAPRGPLLDLPDSANTRFQGSYKILVRPDGRLIIPDDKPGYVLDTGDVSNLDTDLILSDGDRYVFMDFNSATGAVKRSTVIDASETNQP